MKRKIEMNIMKLVRLGLLLLLGIEGLAQAQGGTTQAMGGNYYVGGTSASDRNPGTASQPFATIQRSFQWILGPKPS